MTAPAKLPIPPAALAQHTIALGKTGAGKSSAMRVLVEHLLERDVPVCIVDPKGDWWGIKSSADGKKAGYPVVIFGGEHADVPINEHSGAAVAELVARGNRPALIDLGGFMMGERVRFFVAFASAFFKHARGARQLVIDEVHNFAPQGKVLDVDAGKMLHWSNRLASEGRGKGIALLAASQRPQKVHKDFLTSCETLIAMRVIHKLDRDAVKDWIDGCADPAIGKTVIAELAGMKRGEAWAWSPEIEFGPERVTFPMFQTFDSFKPRGAGDAALKGWAEVDLQDVKTKLAAVVAEAAANDPKALKARIRELERQAKTIPSNEAPKTNASEVRELRRGLEQLERSNASLKAYAGDLFAAAALSQTLVDELEEKVRALRGIRYPKQPKIVSTSVPAAAAPTRPLARQAVAAPVPRPPSAGAGELGKGERAMLIAIAQSGGDVEPGQLTVLTGYKRSSRDTYCQRLRAAGYITAGWPTRATDEGIAALGDFEPLPTGADLGTYWLQRLAGGEQRILQALIDAYPSGLTRDQLDDQAGFKRSSRDTYLQRLSARKLIEKQGSTVFASELLF